MRYLHLFLAFTLVMLIWGVASEIINGFLDEIRVASEIINGFLDEVRVD